MGVLSKLLREPTSKNESDLKPTRDKMVPSVKNTAENPSSSPSSSASSLASNSSSSSCGDVNNLTLNCPCCGCLMYKVQKSWLGGNKKATPLVEIVTTTNGEQMCKTCSTQSTPVGGGNVVYIGDYDVRGQRSGHGELIWDNGDRFVGNFWNGNRDGHGTIFFNDGSEYSGEWQFNKMHGIGTRRFANGDVYTGNYRDGQRDGFGKLFFKNGNLYVGEWQQDVFHGKGRMYFTSQKKGQLVKSFEGNFVRGIRQGKGKFQQPNGLIEIFRYQDDVPVGPGVRWSADRTKVWQLKPNEKGGKAKVVKEISIAEAVSIGYSVDAEVTERVEDLDNGFGDAFFQRQEEQLQIAEAQLLLNQQQLEAAATSAPEPNIVC